MSLAAAVARIPGCCEIVPPPGRMPLDATEFVTPLIYYHLLTVVN